MNVVPPFPRASPGTIGIDDSTTFNRKCDAIERANMLDVASPLRMTDDPVTGKTIYLDGVLFPVSVKISTALTGSGFYTGKIAMGYPVADPTMALVLPDTGETFPSADNCVVENMWESGISSSHWIVIGAIVPCFYAGVTNESPPRPMLRCLSSYPYAMFPVALTQTGGSNGTQTTASTYSYTVKDIAGNTLGTSMTPAVARPNGLITAATWGTGYFNGSGTFVLFEVKEIPDTGSDCT